MYLKYCFAVFFISCWGLVPDSVSLERTLLFDMGDTGSKFYRIPGLIMAVDGVFGSSGRQALGQNK